MFHSIQVNKTELSECTVFNKNFKRCIGTGRFDLAMRKDYMDNLRIVQEEIGFEWIRGHGIFSDHTGVYRKSIQVDSSRSMELDHAIHNFSRVLKVMDHYRSVGIKPMIELGFMPKDMAAGSATVFWWKGNVTDPRELEEWLTLVERLFVTLIEHYGAEEVVQWPIEVWNEPNANFWQPVQGEDKELAYYQLYEATALRIKQVHPRLRVGGPATNGQGMHWLQRFIDYCSSREVPVDFISQHVYSSYDKVISGEFVYMKLIPPGETVQLFEEINSQVRGSRLSDLPIYITEWNTSYSCIELVHDTALNAAYIAWVLTHADHLADALAYWVFCDVFEEADVPRAPFHGGFGLLTENGIRKPVFHTFAFANRLKPYLLHLDDYACVTMDEQGHAAVLLFNPCQDEQGESVEIELNLVLPYKEAMVRTDSVDEERGNAYKAWRKLGSPRCPLPRETEIIRKSQYPATALESRETDEEGKLQLQLSLPRNGMKLVDIFPRRDQLDQYQGLQTKYL